MLVGALVAASVVLAGCAGQAMGAPASTATPTVSATPSPAGISGTGPTGFPGVDFPLEAGARSVSVEFACSSGAYSVELSDSMMLGQAPVSGECAAGTATLTWPITERTTETLSVTVAEGVDWTAVPTFSDESFATDATIAADCEQFGPIYSAFMNADQGYTFYGELDADHWAARVDEASAELGSLAGSAQSELRESFERLVPLVSARADQVGQVMHPDLDGPLSAINAACNANQTPLIVQGEFGG